MPEASQRIGGQIAAAPPTQPQFVKWPKAYRLNRDIIVTEKIDGTNAAIIVTDDGQVHAQSRNKLITPETDSYGILKFVHEHAEHLVHLGVGHHFGEWYGHKVQRGYGIAKDDPAPRRFMLFDTERWGPTYDPTTGVKQTHLPGVPGLEVSTVLYQGLFEQSEIDDAISRLRHHGSQHVPGFKRPEGVVVFHTASATNYKVTLENDEQHKYERAEAHQRKA